MGSLDVDGSSWRRVAWMMAGVVMAMVDQRHAAVEYGSEVEWVRSWCERAGAISVVWRDLGRGGGGGGGTI